jgi:hypothetical protein
MVIIQANIFGGATLPIIVSDGFTSLWGSLKSEAEGVGDLVVLINSDWIGDDVRGKASLVDRCILFI